jgi:hypothetical protein
LGSEALDRWFTGLLKASFSPTGLNLPAWPDFDQAARQILAALAEAGRLIPVKAAEDADLVGTAYIYTVNGEQHVLDPREVVVVRRNTAPQVDRPGGGPTSC